MLFSFAVLFISANLLAQPSCPPAIKTRVMLLGDSWTHIMWNNLTYRDVFNQFGFADIIERGTNTAIGGTTAHYWAQPANLAVIVNELQQNTDINIVLISIGGNDMLAGMNGNIPGWHTGLSSADEALLFDQIQANMQTIVDAIKNVRPDIEIVFSGYDYINLVETVPNSPPTALLWANLGQPTPYQINTAFARFDQRKINMANADPRVHYVNSFGLMQHIYGYPNIFAPYTVPAPGLLPPAYSPYPGGDPNFPTPPTALAAGGTDAIHLSDEGYKNLVVNQMVGYFHNKFRGGPNASFKSEGGTNDGWIRSDGNIGVGNIRVGDHSNGSIYRGIVSFNTASLPDNATITGASIFINRASLTGQNPFSGGFLGTPKIDVKQGTFGAAGIEVSDYFDAADAVDAGCFIGVAPSNGYTIRIDLKPAGFAKINKTGRTQFRIYFQSASGSTSDYVQFNNGDQPGLLAPYIDIFYTVPPPPATAVVAGNTTICYGTSANIQVTLTGTPPFSITWSDGLTETNITSLLHSRSVSPTANTNYTITNLTDANGPGSATGSASVTVLPQIPVTVTGLQLNYCINSPVSNLTASPPGGTWSGAGISGTVFNPAMAVLQNGGGGTITLHYSGTHTGCPYNEAFSVFVDSGTCSLTGSCPFAEVSGVLNCTGVGPIEKVYESSGRLWVFDNLVPGKTYVAFTCDSCGYDSHLMVRNEADSIFITENDDACSVNSSVTFVAPPSGKVGINLTGERSFLCNPYNCNPHNCQPYNCNPHNCQPYDCNCQTCYQTCYQDETVYMTCYPGGIQIIGGILTSDCIGACTGGFCWRVRYQVPYNCNPYTCNCQTCFQTCYDTCYQTCYDTCYQTCTDKCGTDNYIPCKVTLVCTDCQVPVANISASSSSVCFEDSVAFSANVLGGTCNTTYQWNFGTDAVPPTSSLQNPTGITWSSAGVKQISLLITEPGLGTNTFYASVTVNGKPSGGNLSAPAEVCVGDTAEFLLQAVNNATGYHWHFSSGNISGTGNYRQVVVTDSLLTYFVVPYNGVCVGDTFSGSITVKTSPVASVIALGNTTLCPGEQVVLSANVLPNLNLQWQQNSIDIANQQSSTYTAAVAGVYRVVVSDTSGCSSVSNEIAVAEYPAPQGLLTGSSVACENTPVQLFAAYSNATGYVWLMNGSVLAGENDSVLTVTTSGSYSVIVSNNYCSDTSSTLLVSFFPLPVADAGIDVQICEGDSVLLQASGGGGYVWSTGAQTSAIMVSPNVSSIYFVTVTSSLNCSASDSVNVVVYPLPQVPVIAISGGWVTANGSYASYQWYINGTAVPGETNSSILINVSGNYQLLVTDSNGCSVFSNIVSILSAKISDTNYSGWKVYPNPANNELFVVCKIPVQLVTLCISNMLGEVVLYQQVNDFTKPVRLFLGDLPAGVYFLKAGEHAVFKVMKE